jgi:23S rRNA (pseudouridine1915-N3)-methyltransferase
MRIHLVTVANKAPAWVIEGYNEYARRMPPEVRLDLIEVKPEPREGGKTAEQMMAAEAKRILAAIPKGAMLVALDERGRDIDTKGLAKLLEGWLGGGADVALVVGGPDGLAPEIKSKASALLRMSSLTLPHAMVRVLLAEALYRAWSVVKGHPYHRE